VNDHLPFGIPIKNPYRDPSRRCLCPRVKLVFRQRLSLSLSLSASPESYVAELFVIVRRSSNRAARRAKRLLLLLPRSEPRESLNDVTFVVSLPRRRAFARLNCTSSVSTQAALPRLVPRFFSRPSFARSVFSPSFLKDLYSASRRPDK